MRPCDSLSRFSEASSASSSAAKLAAQRADLLVQHLDLRQRARRDLLFGIQRLVEFAGAAGGVVAGAGEAVIEALDPVALGFGGGEAGAHLRQLVVEIELAEFFQRQQVVQLRQLGVERLQRLVLAGDFLRQEELHHQEHRQQEHDREHQRRQRIDEARPVVEAGSRCGVRGQGPSGILRSSRVPDAVQRATLLRRAGTHTMERVSWAPAQQRTASRCTASGARNLVH